MNYEFPRIVHIQQALDAIKGDEDLFYVVEKDGYTVINYKLPCNKTFPAVVDRNAAIRRELRGIKFKAETGETMSRPFHKFFNFGEREETLATNVNISKPCSRLEKLDGSMVHPMRLGGGIRWATKMGVTDTSMQVETWLMQNNSHEIIDFCNEMMDEDYTPIFEWCSRKNRIVVDYPKDRLVLTALRHTFEGDYASYGALKILSEDYGIEVVTRDETPVTDMTSYSEKIYATSGGPLTEGEVLRFSDGHMLKLKTQEYVNLHRTKDKIRKERHFVAVLLSGNLDDLKPFMIQEDLKKAELYEAQLNENVTDICASILSNVHSIVTTNMPRKDFALNKNVDPFVKQTVFHLWDRDFEGDIANVIFDEVMRRLADACEHEQKFERLAPVLLKGCVW